MNAASDAARQAATAPRPAAMPRRIRVACAGRSRRCRARPSWPTSPRAACGRGSAAAISPRTSSTTSPWRAAKTARCSSRCSTRSALTGSTCSPASMINASYIDPVRAATRRPTSALGNPTIDLNKWFLSVQDALALGNKSAATRVGCKLGRRAVRGLAAAGRAGVRRASRRQAERVQSRPDDARRRGLALPGARQRRRAAQAEDHPVDPVARRARCFTTTRKPDQNDDQGRAAQQPRRPADDADAAERAALRLRRGR